MSPCLSPRRRQQLAASPGRLPLLASTCAVPLTHRCEFLVVTGSAGRDDRQPPCVQEPLQLPVPAGSCAAWYWRRNSARSCSGSPSENDSRVLRVLNLGRARADMHASYTRIRSDQRPAWQVPAASALWRQSLRRCCRWTGWPAYGDQLTVSAAGACLPGALTIVATIL